MVERTVTHHDPVHEIEATALAAQNKLEKPIQNDLNQHYAAEAAALKAASNNIPITGNSTGDSEKIELAKMASVARQLSKSDHHAEYEYDPNTVFNLEEKLKGFLEDAKNLKGVSPELDKKLTQLDKPVQRDREFIDNIEHDSDMSRYSGFAILEVRSQSANHPKQKSILPDAEALINAVEKSTAKSPGYKEMIKDVDSSQLQVPSAGGTRPAPHKVKS